jgi:hypothetical protein
MQAFLTASKDIFQNAYKPKRFTTDTVSCLMHRILRSLDERSKCVRVCFIDFSNAFDSLDRTLLLQKLAGTEMHGSILSLLQDYLFDRKQYVQIGSKRSTTILSESGVPQGAVLSPFLFTLYTDSLNLENPSIVIKYADNIAVGRACSTTSDSVLFQRDIEATHSWAESIFLHLNPIKCAEIVFTLRRGRHLNELQHIIPQTVINGRSVEQVACTKYLGVKLSSDLSWHDHVGDVFMKIRRLCFFIRRLTALHIPLSIVKTFITATALPIILYCSPVVFAGLQKTDFIVIKRCIRMLSISGMIDPYFLIETLTDRHIKSCSNLLDTILLDPSHLLYPDLLNCLPKRPLRSTGVHLYTRTSAYKNSIVPYLARLRTSPTSFKNELHDMLMI